MSATVYVVSQQILFFFINWFSTIFLGIPFKKETAVTNKKDTCLSFKIDVFGVQGFCLSFQSNVIICCSSKITRFVIQLHPNLIHLSRGKKKIKLLYWLNLKFPALSGWGNHWAININNYWRNSALLCNDCSIWFLVNCELQACRSQQTVEGTSTLSL